MQTISTKLDKTTANKFLEICNDEGKCQSEMFRDMIQNICNYEDKTESIPQKRSVKSNPKPIIETIFD